MRTFAPEFLNDREGMNTANKVYPTQAYWGGRFAAYMEYTSMSTPLTESRVGEIKEDLKHYCEKKIDVSQISGQEKEEQKRQMKQCLEVYIMGVKDRKYGE